MDIYLILGGTAILIIFSYLFDAFARKTQFPSVLLLIATGIGLRFLADSLNYHVPFLDRIIPTLGTIGLILIVLEGALELEINKEKKKVILQGFLAALFILLGTTFGLGYMLHVWIDVPFLEATLEVTPLAIISSAVAIPSAAGLAKMNKEFIVYESTFSDILGIVLFYFLKGHLVNDLTNEPLDVAKILDFNSYLGLLAEIGIVILVSIIVTYILFTLIERISHNVKFFLILALLILSYVIAKKYHLSALIIIFFFGLFMANTKNMLPEKLRRFVPTKKVDEGLHEFHILTAESTFLIRTFFFLFFGFTITVDMFTDPNTYVYGIAIIAIIILVRFIYIGVTMPKNIAPVGFIAPRGLITILLFLDLPLAMSNDIINEKVLLIVILGSMLFMLTGLLLSENSDEKNDSSTNHTDFNKVGDV